MHLTKCSWPISQQVSYWDRLSNWPFLCQRKAMAVGTTGPGFCLVKVGSFRTIICWEWADHVQALVGYSQKNLQPSNIMTLWHSFSSYIIQRHWALRRTWLVQWLFTLGGNVFPQLAIIRGENDANAGKLATPFSNRPRKSPLLL